MLTLSLAMLLAVRLGPMAPDAPAREPQMAAGQGIVALTFGAGKAIYFSASHDSGKTLSTPVKVAEAEVVPLSRHRGPRIALSGRAIVISAVIGKTLSQGQHAHGLPSDGDLEVWRSTDGGKLWSKGTVINDSPGASTEGLHALASDTKGNLFAAWLDKRGGVGTTLYGAHSADGGITWSKNVLIYQSPDGTICQCCHPSSAISGDGEILVMWRNCLNGGRDMYLTRSRNGLTFSKPQKLGTGSWQLNACPMDGGGLAILQHRIITAWRRENEIFLDSPGERETGIGEGKDVAIAAGKSGVYAVWSTPSGVKALAPGDKEPLTLAPVGAFPNVIGLPAGSALAAWEAEGEIVIQQVP